MAIPLRLLVTNCSRQVKSKHVNVGATYANIIRNASLVRFLSPSMKDRDTSVLYLVQRSYSDQSTVPSGKQIVDIMEEQQQKDKMQTESVTEAPEKKVVDITKLGKADPDWDLDAAVEEAEEKAASREWWKLKWWQKMGVVVLATVCADVLQNLWYAVLGPPNIIITDEDMDWFKRRLNLPDDLEVTPDMTPVQIHYSRMLQKAEDGDTSDFVYRSLRGVIDIGVFSVSTAVVCIFL